MIRRIALLAFILAAGTAAAGDELIQDFSWTQLQGEGKTLPGEVSPAGSAEAFETIKVVNDDALPRIITLLEIEAPKITRAGYVLRGQVRCEGVEGQAFLEMWSHFPGGGAYFSRTLALSGPMQALHGNQAWRAFELPFMNKEGAPGPTRLVLNVALPGKGTVWLSGVRLAHYSWQPDNAGAATWDGAGNAAAASRMLAISIGAMLLLLPVTVAMWVKRASRPTLNVLAIVFAGIIVAYAVAMAVEIVPLLREIAPGRAGAWWSDQAAGLVGGSAGGLLGLMGALVGVFTSMGVGRKAVLGILYGMLGCGAAALFAGLFALTRSQPYAVWYPLTLIGILLTVMAAIFIPTIKRRFQEMELRMMSAMDRNAHG
jgi:hypothetical protein